MKILHVCGSFPPAYAYGGPPRSVDNLTSALAKRGHDVTVYTTDAKDADSRTNVKGNEYSDTGVYIRRFRNISNRLSWKNIQLPPAMLPALLNNIDEFDVVHTHEFRSPPSVFAHIAAERADVPHVHQARGSIPRYELKYLKKIFDVTIGNRFIAATDKLIASSQTESSNYTTAFPKIDTGKVSHVPNGLPAEMYENIPESDSFRTKHNIGEDESIVLFLSRLHPRKGGDLLIKAVSELSLENVSLVFVGPDEGARTNWKSLASQRGIDDHTLFVGPLYGSEKLEAYVDADLFVLPSKNEYESFGNVVVEAMACGTPAVTTNVCGVSEWLDHESCHAVLPTPAALRNGIVSVLNGDVIPSKSIRQYALENFTWDAVAADTEAVYKEVI